MEELPPSRDKYTEALAAFDAGIADSQEILATLQESADSGDDRAKYAIASWYIDGKTGAVDADPRKAILILKDLQNSNIPEALFDLAVFYDYGKWIRRNERKAFSLYLRSALLGLKDSCEQMAEFYREGKIVMHDRDISRAWQVRSEQQEADISPPYRVWLREPRGSRPHS